MTAPLGRSLYDFDLVLLRDRLRKRVRTHLTQEAYETLYSYFRRISGGNIMIPGVMMGIAIPGSEPSEET